MSEPVETPLQSRAQAGARPATTADLAEKVRSLRLSDTPDHSHQGGSSWLPWFLVLLFAGSSGYLGFRVWEQQDAKSEPPVAQKSADSSATGTNSTPGSGTTASTIPGAAAIPPGSVVLESKGYVVPAHQILLTPRVSGMVIELFIEEGKRVKKGDILAKLETTDYQAEFDRATAVLEATRNRLKELENGNRPEEIQQARAELSEMTFQREQLRESYQRVLKLRQNRAVSPDELDKAESAYKAMESRVEKLKQAHDLMVKGPRTERISLAKAEVRQSEADLVKAKWRLDNCTILSPISGTILTKKAEEGNMVNPIAFSGSQALCEMADLADLEVDLSIQERDVSKVFKDQKCIVRAEAYPNRAYSGIVSRLMPIADRAKGAIPVRVKLTVPANEEGIYLKPEMGAVVTFYSRESPPESLSSEPSKVPAPTPVPAEAAKQQPGATSARTPS